MILTRSFICTILLLLTLSCQEEKQVSKENVTNAVVPEKPVNNDSVNISNFKKFRDAIKSGDDKKNKSYFMFPMLNSGLWALVENQDIETGTKYSDPFTESDFDKYKDVIFSEDFMASLFSVEPMKLTKSKTYSTLRLKKQREELELTYWMQCEYRPADEMILSLNYEFDDKGEKVETSFIYFFSLDKNGVPTFKKVMLAG